jgi:hypothetical protein
MSVRRSRKRSVPLSDITFLVPLLAANQFAHRAGRTATDLSDHHADRSKQCPHRVAIVIGSPPFAARAPANVLSSNQASIKVNLGADTLPFPKFW